MKYMIWGTGEMAVGIVSQLGEDNIICYIESAPVKESYKGVPVISPDDIVKYKYDCIFIANHYVKEIMDVCRQKGIPLDEKIVPLLPVFDLSITSMEEWMRIKEFVDKPYWEKLVMDVLPGYIYEKIQCCMDHTINPLILQERYKDSENPEIMEILEYTKKNKCLSMLNYDFPDIKSADIQASFDDNAQMYYVQQKNGRMYFPKYWPKDRVERYYYEICIVEQSANSPHSYCMDGYQVKFGDYVADIGAAEGCFTLTNMDKIKKAYLVECDGIWLEALAYTFRPYKDRVEFIDKYLSDYDDANHVTLDTLGKTRDLDFIKMDIEGAEITALKGGEHILRNRKATWAVCVYHRKTDYGRICDCLLHTGHQISVQPGWIYAPETLFDVELKRGVLFGKKR